MPAITATDADGITHIPSATIGRLLLGPGTRVTHQALTAGHLKDLKGGDVHQLWVTTAPGRPRGGAPAPPAGLPATIRTLESAHRKLTATVLGTPLLLEQFCTAEQPPGRPARVVADVSGPPAGDASSARWRAAEG